jgi:hypothetical protein
MIVFGGSRGSGCGALGCLPLLLLGVVITILVFFFAV